jgi:hypothetical protein
MLLCNAANIAETVCMKSISTILHVPGWQTYPLTISIVNMQSRHERIIK